MSITREEWLEKGIDALSVIFEENGYSLPHVKVSCSWPGGGSKNNRIGECWPRSASHGGVNEIYISPTIEHSTRCLDILAHELIHAIDDCQNGHRKPFTTIMRTIGLTGKPTATIAGEQLLERLNSIVEKIGEYPHKKIGLNPNKKKQSTRMLKFDCFYCGAIWRMSSSAGENCHYCPCCQSKEINKPV